MSVKRDRQRSGYQMCVEELVWPWVVRWPWAISINSNADAQYQNCLIFWASRCILAPNSQHIIMFSDWILYFFGDWSKNQSENENYNIVFFSNFPSYGIRFDFSLVSNYGHAGYDNCSTLILHVRTHANAYLMAKTLIKFLKS